MTLLRTPGAKVAATTLLVFALLALLAPFLLPDPTPIPAPTAGRLLAPSFAHPLGTDALSRDVLARLARGGAISLSIGLIAALLAALLG